MTYEELLQKKNELTTQMKQIDEALAEHEEAEFIASLETAITELKKAYELKPYVSVEIEDVECEQCREVTDINVDLEVIYYAIQDLKRGYEK